MKKPYISILLLALAAVFMQFPSSAVAAAVKGTTERISLASSGEQADGPSFWPAVSANGRFVAFTSEATNLVNGDSNGLVDVFVRDRAGGTTELVSVASDGTQADRASLEPSISANGRYVAFLSDATNLVSGDNNGTYDVFVHDRQTGLTSLVSLANDGTPGNGISPSISADGRFVAFISNAAISSDDHNHIPDVYIYELQSGLTERVTEAGDPEPYPNPYSDPWDPVVSADGRFVVFTSEFWPIAGLVLRDRQAGRLEPLQPRCPAELKWDCTWLRARSISNDGRFVAFYNQVGGLGVYVYDRVTGITENPGIDLDGGWASGISSQAVGSGDMRFVAFDSWSSRLVPSDHNGQQDVFVRDRSLWNTTLLSLSSAGDQGNGPSFAPSISANGRYVSFVSLANNLVSGDSNNQADIFLRDRGGGILQPVERLYFPLAFR